VAPDLDREMRVEADASNFVTGGVLLMKCEKEVETSCLYFKIIEQS